MKITSSNLFLAFCFVCLTSFVRIEAKQINFRLMSFIDKMSTNSIFNIYQDMDGFVWLATANGVVRYDGYDTYVFRNDFQTPHQLNNNDVRCFAENNSDIWVGTTQGITLLDKSTFKSRPLTAAVLQNICIRDMVAGKENHIWVVTDYKVFRCNKNGDVMATYTFPVTLNRFFRDRDGVLWLLSTRGDIFRFDERLDCFNKFSKLDNCNLYQMTQDEDGIFWIATWGSGIWRFNPLAANKEEMFRKQPLVNPIRNLPETVFYDIIQDDSYGFIWALSHFRLYILKKNEQGNLEEADAGLISNGQFPTDFYKTYSRVIKDRNGNLWLGAYDQGYIVSFKKDNIENHILDYMKENVGLDANIIYFNKDWDGIIWFNQARYGLCLLDENNGRITYGIGNEDKLYSKDVLAIVPSRLEKAVWLGGRVEFATKVWKMARQGMQINILEEYDLKNVEESPGNITQLVEDNVGNLWIGTSEKLFYKSKDSILISKIALPSRGIVDVASDVSGGVWACSGKDIFKVSNNNIRIEKHYDASSLLLEEDEFVSKCCANHDGELWYATSLGRIYRLNGKTNRIIEQTEQYNLSGDEILKILVHNQCLWIVCAKFVTCHDLKEKKNTYYSVTDENILISSIRYGAAFVDDDGNLYVGGHKGFIKILADQPKENQNRNNAKVFITDVRTDGRSALFAPVKEEMGNSMSNVRLKPNSRNIEIRFSSFPYESHRNVKYAYKMEGVDDNWYYIGNNEHTAFYNRLDKGKYTFMVKSTDANGVWSDKCREIEIQSLPMWYETELAYLMYSLLLLFGVILIFYFYTKHIEQKNSIKFQEQLTQIKLDYFTGISHELFSPLATMICATDVLEKEKTYQNTQIEILRSNINRLKRLLQQILDFRKVESGKMALLIEKGNITERVQSIIASNFQPLAHKKHIRLTSQIEEGIWGYCDFDKLDKILFNLLSNAIKYTPEYKKVMVIMQVNDKAGVRYLNVEVCDEGVGIDSKELKHIFTKFYHNKQAGYGETNGLGLSLIKDLITIHHGSIKVESELNEGSVFTVELPIDKEVYSDDELFLEADSPLEEVETIAEDKEIPQLLFVDDNSELRLLMEKLFAEKYHILTASDGKEGLDILKKTLVDIVVCDVMMPGMDGLEFCSMLKRNSKTNHIPIIMLTAKNGANAQIESYQAGADSFIEKPFDMKILHARIENLLQTARNRQRSFQTQFDTDITDLEYQVFDEDFLQNAISCVKKHLVESEFGIEGIASELGMSRSTLSRKLKALTGMTPLNFIRNIKLKYACELLKNKSANISDIAYYLGFSSPKYFTKNFKKEFGMTPSEYQEKIEND